MRLQHLHGEVSSNSQYGHKTRKLITINLTFPSVYAAAWLLACGLNLGEKTRNGVQYCYENVQTLKNINAGECF